jgi:hypothetical protein
MSKLTGMAGVKLVDVCTVLGASCSLVASALLLHTLVHDHRLLAGLYIP